MDFDGGEVVGVTWMGRPGQLRWDYNGGLGTLGLQREWKDQDPGTLTSVGVEFLLWHLL